MGDNWLVSNSADDLLLESKEGLLKYVELTAPFTITPTRPRSICFGLAQLFPSKNHFARVLSCAGISKGTNGSVPCCSAVPPWSLPFCTGEYAGTAPIDCIPGIGVWFREVGIASDTWLWLFTSAIPCSAPDNCCDCCWKSSSSFPVSSGRPLRGISVPDVRRGLLLGIAWKFPPLLPSARPG